jgi:hypothetical protein
LVPAQAPAPCATERFIAGEIICVRSITAEVPVARSVAKALLTGALGGGQMAAMCAGATDALPLNGMVTMYVLMSAFHAAPWLKLISNRRGLDRRS